MAINEGSWAPHDFSGSLWAIFDQDAVDRTGREIRHPYVSEKNGYCFKSDTIEELARQIYAGHPYARVPLSYLPMTVTTWNGYVAAGADPEFEREAVGPMYAIARPPF